MKQRVFITGLGVISSIGIGRQDFWQGLLRGANGISPVEAFDTSEQFTHNGGEVKNFEPDRFISKDRQGLMSRATQMAVAAAQLAKEDAGIAQKELADRSASVLILESPGQLQAARMISVIQNIHLPDLDAIRANGDSSAQGYTMIRTLKLDLVRIKQHFVVFGCTSNWLAGG